MGNTLLDPNTIMAAASVIAAVTAIVAIWVESRRSRFASGVDLIHNLDREFRSERFLHIRANAARGLLAQPTANTNAVDEIFDFFEEVAFFVRRGALDLETTWYFFFSYMYRFHTVAAEYIAAQRRSDATLWHNHVTVYPKLLAIEERDRAKLGSRKKLSEDDLAEFLRDETRLLEELAQASERAPAAAEPSNALEPAAPRVRRKRRGSARER